MIVVSFGKNPDFLLPKVAYLFTLENYKSICTVKSVHFIDYLKNSLIISSIVATISVLIASLSAYAISRLKFPGRVLIPITIIALSMFPQISIVGYLFKLMSNLGWINTYNSLIFPYIAWAMPLALWIVLSYFMQIPEELDEAALMDGATRIQILFRVIFPIALPGLFSTLLLIFIFSFNEFLFALMLTTDWRARTIPIGIALFQGLHGEIPWGEIMAASVIAVVPLVLLTLIFQRNIIEGLTRGALK
jgi:multiple sugar transport system permease protein